MPVSQHGSKATEVSLLGAEKERPS